MAFWIEIAKLLAGVALWDFVAHLIFIASKVEPKLLGIHFTDKHNKIAAVIQLVIAALLIYLGWFSGLNI